jgi:ATP-dependent protease ClpP protease subunit
MEEVETIKRIWELKQRADNPAILDMYIYGDVESDGYDWWSGEDIISETSANTFRNELAKHPDASEINVYINSYGGSVFEGTAIYNQLKRHPATVNVYVDGFACSVASIIAMAGDKIIMPSNAMMMIHNAWNVVYGNSKELRKAADDLDVIMEGNMQAYLEKAGDKLSEATLRQMLEDETWLTAKQCLEYGLCDEIAGREADMTKAQEMLQKVNQSLTSKVNYNKAIAAQIREMAEVNKKPEPIQPIAEPDPVPDPIVENKLQSFFKSLKK